MKKKKKIDIIQLEKMLYIDKYSKYYFLFLNQRFLQQLVKKGYIAFVDAEGKILRFENYLIISKSSRMNLSAISSFINKNLQMDMRKFLL